MSYQEKCQICVQIVLDTLRHLFVFTYSAAFWEVKSCGLVLQLPLTELHCRYRSNTFVRSAALVCNVHQPCVVPTVWRQPRVIECMFWSTYYLSQIFISKATHWRSIPWRWFTSWRDGTGLFDRLWSQHAFVGEADDFKWCLRSGCLWPVWLARVLWMVSCQVPLCNRTLPLVVVLLNFQELTGIN